MTSKSLKLNEWTSLPEFKSILSCLKTENIEDLLAVLKEARLMIVIDDRDETAAHLECNEWLRLYSLSEIYYLFGHNFSRDSEP